MAAYEVMKKYDWRYNDLPVKAQVAGEYLEKLEEENGSLTAELVLEESRAETATLHNCFDWNDSTAAEKYRVEQARYILRNIIKVLVQNPTDEVTDQSTEVTVRAFVNVSEDKKGRYVAIETALRNENSRECILKRALTELRSFQNKYSIYAELTDVCKAIDDFAARLGDAE